MNQKLGSTARELIRKKMSGLDGKAAKAMAVALAGDHDCSWQYVYRMTTDLRQTNRKTRSDAGRRTFDLTPGTDTYYAAQLVVVDKLDPDQALLTAKIRGKSKLPELGTFQKLLRENGLGKTQLKKSRRAHRRWEAEFPGQIFQIDCTALKVRWRDEKTRRVMRIEGIDKNHPQSDPSKLRVWQIMLTDDHSRRVFLRYVATTAITSLEMVRFECEAFERLGVPLSLYTDNGSEFKGYHLRAERILNTLLKDQGGYAHERHAPNNPQATGKVESRHKWAEKMDRYIGLAETEGQTVDIDDLNRFADEICTFYENRIHRSTGEKPINRWHGKRIVVRKVSPDVVESALLSDEFEVKLDAAMTVTHKKISYKVPNAQPFVDYVGRKVRVVIPHSINLIFLTLPNAEGKFEPTHGGEFEIEKILATVDKAGEYRTVAESTAERHKREMYGARKIERANIKEQKKLTGQIAPVPHLNVPIEIEENGVLNFPHRESVVTAEEVNRVVPVPTDQLAVGGGQSADDQSAIRNPQSAIGYAGKLLTFWPAVAEFKSRFATVDECKSFLAADLFPDQQGEHYSSAIEQAVDAFLHPSKEVKLRAVG